MSIYIALSFVKASYGWMHLGKRPASRKSARLEPAFYQEESARRLPHLDVRALHVVLTS